jgi:uncharacterized protein (DUF302 family)
MNDLGFQVRLKLPFEEAFQKTVEALKLEGFGVLTEIDVKSTMKQKLDVDFRRYIILGACNPRLAHRALSANLSLGLFLPCNITIHEDGDEVVVTAIDPNDLMSALKDDETLRDVAREARQKLVRVIESLN